MHNGQKDLLVLVYVPVDLVVHEKNISLTQTKGVQFRHWDTGDALTNFQVILVYLVLFLVVLCSRLYDFKQTVSPPTPVILLLVLEGKIASGMNSALKELTSKLSRWDRTGDRRENVTGARELGHERGGRRWCTAAVRTMGPVPGVLSWEAGRTTSLLLLQGDFIFPHHDIP